MSFFKKKNIPQEKDTTRCYFFQKKDTTSDWGSVFFQKKDTAGLSKRHYLNWGTVFFQKKRHYLNKKTQLGVSFFKKKTLPLTEVVSFFKKRHSWPLKKTLPQLRYCLFSKKKTLPQLRYCLFSKKRHYLGLRIILIKQKDTTSDSRLPIPR